MQYRLSDFDYDLPGSQIAQHPLPDRSASRLLVLDRESSETRQLHFRDLPDLIPAGDLLVLNTSRVIPARLHGKRETGNPAELLIVRELNDGTWLAMGHPGGKLKPGRRITFGEDSTAEIMEVLGGGLRRVRFVGALDARATIAKYGAVPLPPYIRREPNSADRERYQTVYATHEGSVAAPTAGLHFTTDLLARIAEHGTLVTAVDLHVGPGTFKPVETEELGSHTMHPEAYEISDGPAGGPGPSGVAAPPAGKGRTAGVHAVRTAGHGANAFRRRPQGGRRPDCPRQHVSPACPSRRRRDRPARRIAQVNGVGTAVADGLRGFSGVLARRVSARRRRQGRIPKSPGWRPAQADTGKRHRYSGDAGRGYRNGVRSCDPRRRRRGHSAGRARPHAALAGAVQEAPRRAEDERANLVANNSRWDPSGASDRMPRSHSGIRSLDWNRDRRAVSGRAEGEDVPDRRSVGGAAAGHAAPLSYGRRFSRGSRRGGRARRPPVWLPPAPPRVGARAGLQHRHRPATTPTRLP